MNIFAPPSQYFEFSSGPLEYTVGDRSLILPSYAVKITHPPPGLQWVSRDQELNVEHKYIGLLLYHTLTLKYFAKTGIFKFHFVNFCNFLKDFLQVYWLELMVEQETKILSFHN